MAFQLRGARQAYRSSEGAGISPRSSPRPDRQAAHRSAPVAAPSFDISASLPEAAPPTPDLIEPRRRDRSLAADVPDTYRDSFVSIVDDPFFQRFDFEGATSVLDFEQLSPRDPSSSSTADAASSNPNYRLDFNLDFGPGSGPNLESGLDAGPRHDEGDDLRWPPPRRESLIIGHQSHPVRAAQSLQPNVYAR